MRKSVERAVQPLLVLGDFRFLYLFLPATLVLISDWKGFEALVKTFCVFYALLGLGHLVRKVVVPYLDLRAFVEKANESPVASAIVFCMVLVFYLAMTIIPIWWIRP